MCWPICISDADAAGDIDWNVSCRRHHRPCSPARDEHGHALIRTQGLHRITRICRIRQCEPTGHGIGRLRGGLITKILHTVDGDGRPLAVVITGGHRSEGVIQPQILAVIRVPRPDGGRPRTCPDAVLADRASGSKVNSECWCSRGIPAVIPEKKDQSAAWKKFGGKSGRPRRLRCQYLSKPYVVECSFAFVKQWRGLARRNDKLATVCRATVVVSAIVTWLR